MIYHATDAYGFLYCGLAYTVLFGLVVYGIVRVREYCRIWLRGRSRLGTCIQSNSPVPSQLAAGQPQHRINFTAKFGIYPNSI